MAKTKGQEAANRARSGKANRKSAATQERLGSGWLSIPKNPVELLKEAGSEIKGFVDYQQKLYVNPLANKVNQGITAATGGKVKFQKLKEPTKKEVATEIAGQLAGAAAGKVVGYAANTIARSGAGAAVKNFVSENTPVLRKTMLNAVDAERKIARSAFQREADIMTRQWTAQTRRLTRQAKTYRRNFMDTYEQYSPAYDVALTKDIASDAPTRAGKFNRDIQDVAARQDFMDDVITTTHRDFANEYLRARGSAIRDAMPSKRLARKNNPDLQEEFNRKVQEQLMKTSFRRQGMR